MEELFFRWTFVILKNNYNLLLLRSFFIEIVFYIYSIFL